VATLLAKTDDPARGQWATKEWDGTWDNGTHSGKFADPKQYTVRLDLYPTESASTPIATRTVPIHVARLGVQQISFTGDQELVYHKTSPSSTTNVPFTDNTTFANDLSWNISDLDVLKSDAGARPRTEAKMQKNAVGESFSDDDNSGTRNGSEWYFDVDGSGSYTGTLRQANFPGQKPDPAHPADTSKAGGPDTDNWNRPVAYVRGTNLQMRFSLGANAISDITAANIAAGYPVTAYPVRIKAAYSSADMTGINQTATANVLNISPAGGPYELRGIALPNTVGYAEETVTFRYQYNATGESFVDTNGNGTFDTGEPLVDKDSDGEFDEDWRDIPGSQTTSHLIYRLVNAPTALALSQATNAGGGGINALYMKIVDFTCAWGQDASASNTDDVWAAIWETNNLWTPVATGPPPHPDNANGFVGRGDPVESNRADKWTNTPKCYTYDHDVGVEETVDYALDNNVTRCGGWARLLTAFAGYHGRPVSPIQITALWIRERGGVASVQPIAGGGWVVGDTVWCHDIRAGCPPGVIWLQVGAIDGQANPHGGRHLGTGFNLHRIAYRGAGGTLRIYDPSYDHQAGVAGGRARAGWTAYHDYEQDALTGYEFPLKATVTAVDGTGNITGVTALGANVVRPNDAALTEIETSVWP
jgi:hypothetical protein